MFDPVSPSVNFKELEERILDSWKRNGVVEEALAEKEDRPRFVFYEGPPTANNRPGLHHVWARVFKDIYCRYKTMRGFFVPRKAGWDCHGLPVELEIEKELGIERKAEIETFGIDRFNAKCRESVQRYVVDWEALTERIGFWLDVESAYWTMHNDYIESVWWQLGRVWDKGLLYKDTKVVPYCPRCGTALSSHEVAQGYQEIEDPSVYVRFPMIEGMGAGSASLLVWTTTPWTLVSNVAVAAHPTERYVEVEYLGERLILAEARLAAVFKDAIDNCRVLASFAGSELAGRYERPFDYLEPETSEAAYTVVHDDFVTMEEGTGLVHLAPAFGEIDREVGKRYGLGAPNPVDAEGKFDARVKELEGIPVRSANTALIEKLDRSGRLFRSETYRHSYPHCWRCNTPLIYWSTATWYIRTTQYRSAMLEENSRIGWHPEHIRDGRFGDWLANNVDWSLSRDRYWGTPLPIWTCDKGHATFVDSKAKLAELAGRDLGDLDLHRPYVDEITIECPQCPPNDRSLAQREQAVLDAWFDSGAMPAAQFAYPYTPDSSERFEKNFPADFIAEGIDQTRGWFYSLLAISTLVFGRSSYKNVLCLGHIVDAEGRKMSKRLGNVIDPWTILDKQGADALRWYFVSSGSPWVSSRVSMEAIEKSTSQFLLTLWNTYSFFVTYARADRFDGSGDPPPLSERPLLDRWILSRLSQTVTDVTEALESYDALTASRKLEAFVKDVSNWYVRRSRRRFWSARSAVSEKDKEAAYHTLLEVLVTVARLLAPICPFVSEEIYLNLSLSVEGKPRSVHLDNWPEPCVEAVDNDLEKAVATVRRLVTLGRAARTQARIKIRQPLRRALLSVPWTNADSPSERSLQKTHAVFSELLDSLKEELNVDSIEWADPASMRAMVDIRLKPNYKSVGPKLGKAAKALPEALASIDAREAAAHLERGQTVSVNVGGTVVELDSEDLIVERVSPKEFAVAMEGDFGVALDTRVDDELRARGLLRELTHKLQDLRKQARLEVSDRIDLWLVAPHDERLAAVIKGNAAEIASELLAVSLIEETPPEGDVAIKKEIELDGSSVIAGLRRATGS
ncbi:MAG: isoleucine--tRNA ligase [Acidimicrobiia bacterium]